MKEGGTAVAFRLPINFGFIPAAWIQQESTSVFVTGHMQTRFHRLANSWELSAHRQLLGKSWPRCMRRKCPQGSSKQNTAGLRTGQSYGRGRECTGHRLGFHL